MRIQNYYDGTDVNCQSVKISRRPNMSCRRDVARRVSTTIMVVIIFTLNAFTSTAQMDGSLPGETGTRVLHTNDSLFHYLQTALQNNPLVLQRFAEYMASLEKIPQAGALPDPELTAGIFLTPMELVMGEQVADLSLMQMFPWFGVLKNAKDEMSLMAKAEFEEFRNARLEVLYDVQRTWYELYRIEQNIRFSKRNLEILKSIERLSLTKYRSGSTGNSASQSGMVNPSGSAGSVNSQRSAAGSAVSGSAGTSGTMGSMDGQPGSNTGSQNTGMTSTGQSMQTSMSTPTGGSGLADLYRIQIETGELENMIQLYGNQKNSTLARFNSFLNRDALTPVWVPDTLYADSLETELSLIPDSIRKSNPALAMILLEQQSLEARKEMNRRMGLPMVGVGLNYSVVNRTEMAEGEMNGRDMVMPMVKVTLPVYRKKYRASVSEAAALISASVMSYQAALNGLTNEYYEAVQLYTDAFRRIKLYKEQARLAERSLDVMIRSFSGASVQLTDLLSVQRQLLDYEVRQTEAVTDFNTSVAWLRKLTGITPAR